MLEEYQTETYYCPESGMPLRHIEGSVFYCEECGIFIDLSEEAEEDYHG